MPDHLEECCSHLNSAPRNHPSISQNNFRGEKPILTASVYAPPGRSCKLARAVMRHRCVSTRAQFEVASHQPGPGGTAISQAATPRTPLPAHHCPGCAVDSFQSAWRIHEADATANRTRWTSKNGETRFINLGSN